MVERVDQRQRRRKKNKHQLLNEERFIMMEQSITKLNMLDTNQLKELMNSQGKIVLQRVPRFCQV